MRTNGTNETKKTEWENGGLFNMKTNLRNAAGGLLMAGAMLLGGCSLLPQPQADPTRYYVLTAGAAATTAVADPMNAPAKEGSLALGVKRVEIAPYLNGKDMVVREGGNEIAYQNFARWAEPLATGVGRVLAENLARADKVGRVYAQPFSFEVARDYDIAVRVLRCEGDRDAAGKFTARFSALVEVTQSKLGGEIVIRKVFNATATEWDGRDFGKLAAALSEQVGALAAEVVAALPAK